MLPSNLTREQLLYNNTLLATMLNEQNVFDIALTPKPKDRLLLVFDNDSYGFRFKKGKWVVEEFDSHEWLWHHNNEEHVKIKKR